jgi:hypothetical protein
LLFHPRKLIFSAKIRKMLGLDIATLVVCSITLVIIGGLIVGAYYVGQRVMRAINAATQAV